MADYGLKPQSCETGSTAWALQFAGTEGENPRVCGALAFAILFYSSCARSGRATASFINISRLTWWGESSALRVAFPWGSAEAVHSDVGLRSMGSSLGEKEFSVGLQTRWCIPPSVKACRGHTFNEFCLLMVRAETCWRRWGGFLRGLAHRRSKDTIYTAETRRKKMISWTDLLSWCLYLWINSKHHEKERPLRRKKFPQVIRSYLSVLNPAVICNFSHVIF